MSDYEFVVIRCNYYITCKRCILLHNVILVVHNAYVIYNLCGCVCVCACLCVCVWVRGGLSLVEGATLLMVDIYNNLTLKCFKISAMDGRDDLGCKYTCHQTPQIVSVMRYLQFYQSQCK